MKKFFSLVAVLMAAIAMNAATQVTFDFSDATAYGYANPAAGAFTQVPTGAVLTKDDVTITITFESGKNGFRFFANTNTGVVNLRAYVGASFTIAAPEGKKLSAIVADGTNITPTYLSDGMTGKNWSSAEGVASLTTKVIKSTVQFNSLTVTLIEDGEVPPTVETIKVDVAGAITAGMALDSMKTSTDVYEVTGYVVNAQAYSAQHGNQIWWMADDAENTGAQEFEAYACTVSENNTVMQVLNGDKVALTGNLTKYYDKNKNKFIVEIKNGTALFVSKVDGNHSIDGGGDTPVVATDTISVDSALVLGAPLADKAYTDKAYVVEGYVIEAEDFYFPNKNQSWLMADSANATSSNFKAFRCVPVYNNDTVKVLKGDKVRISGKIQKYGDLIEISYSKAEFISMVDADHSAVEPVQEKVDTITVARALEIGATLGTNKSSDSIYVIAGYVSNVVYEYDATSQNETFWMVDTIGGRAASNAAGAFEVFKGKMDAAADPDAMVYVTAKIYKYQKMSNNQPSGDPVIETANSPIPTVHVAVPGTPAVLDTITVAQALEIGQALDSAGVTDVQYIIKGYVSNIINYYDTIYKNETFWMVDEKGSRAASNDAGAFEVYRGKPNTEAEIGLDAYVYVTAKIQNFRGNTIETSGTPLVNVIEQGHEEVIEAITVARALEIGDSIGVGNTTGDRYEITGYVSSIDEKYSEQYGNETFWITDEKGERTNNKSKAFEVYRGKPNTNAEIGMDAKIKIVCKIKNYNGTIENDGSNIVFEVLEQGVEETIDTITVARALEIGQALDSAAITSQEYVIVGYVSNIINYYDTIYKNETFWMTDEKGSRAASNEAGAFEVYRGKPNTEAEIGLDAYVYVTAKIQNFRGTVVETSGTPLVNVIEQGHEEVIEAITVARAVEIGDSIGIGNTTDNRYEITGYVSSISEKYSEQYGNETFWITDEKGSYAASSKAGAFEVYRGKPNTGAEIGLDAKIKIVCKIKNYNGTIENDGSNIVFEVLEQGADRLMDTITVARALEIGQALDSAEISEKEYVIAGYVSSIVNYYDSVYKNETFWIADSLGSRAASNAEGAFEVYRGKPNTEAEIGLNAYVYVTAKIQNFRGNTIETSGTPLVEVVIPGIEEVIDSITVARAIEIGDSIGIGNTTDERYEITGYVSYIEEQYSEQYGNETFWITDTKGERTNDPTKAFEVYRGKPNTGVEIGMDAKIKIVCKIKNFKGTIENDGTNIPFEVLEQGTELKYDTISVKEALAIIDTLAEGATTLDKYIVKGYIAEVTTPYDAQYGNMTIGLNDKFNRLTADLTCYRAKVAEDDVERASVGAYVYVFGKLQNFKNNAQVAQGGQITIAEAPKIDTVQVSLAEAIAIGTALEEDEETDVFYAVTGYVADIIDPGEGTQSFMMSDDEQATTGEFYVDMATIETQATVHQQVCVYGWITNYMGFASIAQGEAVILYQEGIEQLVLTEKAQKVVVDGAVYIIRDNKLYNLQGARIR